MLDLTKIKLPDTIEVEGSFYRINTDFRNWLLFGELINKPNCTYDELIYLFKDIPEHLDKALPELINFYAPKSELPRAMSRNNTDIVLDYTLDADLIYSAFFQVYHIDLLATDDKGKGTTFIHWHKFLALMNGLSKTKLNEVMEIRSYEDNASDKSEYAKNMRQLKRAWRLPQNTALTPAQQHFNELLKKGKK